MEENREVKKISGLEELRRGPDPALNLKVMTAARITVNGYVHYVSPEDEPVTVPIGYDKPVSPNEQPYERQITVGEDWTPLDIGWIKKPSMIVLKNREGTNLRVYPSEEEKRDISERVIQLGVDLGASSEKRDMHSSPRPPIVPLLLFPPGETYPFIPALASSSLYLRCAKGRAKATLTVFPS